MMELISETFPVERSNQISLFKLLFMSKTSFNPFNSHFLVEIAMTHAASEHVDHIVDIRTYPVCVDEENTEECEEKDANAHGVYFYFSEYAQKEFDLSPSEWIADFSDKEPAIIFTDLLKRLLRLGDFKKKWNNNQIAGKLDQIEMLLRQFPNMRIQLPLKSEGMTEGIDEKHWDIEMPIINYTFLYSYSKEERDEDYKRLFTIFSNHLSDKDKVAIAQTHMEDNAHPMDNGASFVEEYAKDVLKLKGKASKKWIEKVVVEAQWTTPAESDAFFLWYFNNKIA